MSTSMKPKKKSAPKKGNFVPDAKPDNDFKKGAKKGIKARKGDKKC